MASGIENRQAVFSRLNTFLKDRGYQLTQCGFKLGDNMGNHVVNEDTGYWDNPGYSKSKPPRWLMNVDVGVDPPVASLPGDLTEMGIGFSNTGNGSKAGLAVRILPIFKNANGEFAAVPDFEVDALFVFHGPLKAGSAADPFVFDAATGAIRRTGEGFGVGQENYVFAALLGLHGRDETIQDETGGAVSYGQVIDAIAAALTVQPVGGAAGPIPIYDLSEDSEAQRLTTDIEAAWNAAGPAPQPAAAPGAAAPVADEEEQEPIDPAAINIPENDELLGIDPAVYRQISAALKSGKQHIMLYGPPGTGKTSLARWIASSLPGGDWTLVTGSSDWSSQDIIGGYQPTGGGNVDFVPGILLRSFDRPFIIDELNRCDIDKVIGPLFTVLSGQETTLPYRTDLADPKSQPYAILPRPKAGKAAHEFAPGPAWRLIATINSIDKASLYQMSYALSRRFGWVYVDAPTDLRGFIVAFVAKSDPAAPAAGDQPCPLADVWAAVNLVRVIGPAPIIDAIAAIREIAPGAAFFGAATADMKAAALDALDMVLLPMLDGVAMPDATGIGDAIIKAFALSEVDAARVKRRLEAVAI